MVILEVVSSLTNCFDSVAAVSSFYSACDKNVQFSIAIVLSKIVTCKFAPVLLIKLILVRVKRIF